MTKVIKSILQSLKNTNYLAGNYVLGQNEELRYQSSLLKNGVTLREQLLKQWTNVSTACSTQYDNIEEIVQNNNENGNRTAFIQSNDFQKSYERICKEKLADSSNVLVRKIVLKNSNNFISKENIFHGSVTGALLVTDMFVPSDLDLPKYYNLQRERKIWWMRISANPSRYSIEPYDLSPKEDVCDQVYKKSKSITIKANFPFGIVDMESISLVPLSEIKFSNVHSKADSYKVSVIRSVIDLNLTTSALILDAALCRIQNGDNVFMINRNLAPYQVLLANLHDGNKTVDELTLHLQHVISKSDLRLYDNYIHTKTALELEKELMHFDSLGIPFTLVVDSDSIKSGLMKLRSRDTTLSETIHISDIPHYLLNIFKQ